MKGFYLRRSFVFFNEAEPQYTVLTVSNLPFELPDNVLSHFLSKYGQIKTVLRNKDSHGFENGDRRVLITLTHHIPSMIFLDPYIGYVKYKDQPMCCHHCNYWGHVISKCGLKRRCTRCSSQMHVSIDCSEPFSMPPPFPIDERIDQHRLTHPLVLKLQEEEILLDQDDVSSTHTMDLFGDVGDLDENDEWPSLEAEKPDAPAASPPPSPTSKPSNGPSPSPPVSSHAPRSTLSCSGSPPPFQTRRQRKAISSGRHDLPFDDGMSDISSPSFSNVLRGAGVKRGPMDVPLSELVTLKKKQVPQTSKKKAS